MDSVKMGASSSKDAGKKASGRRAGIVQCVGPDHRYRLEEHLGKGSFGNVMKAYDKIQKQYVAIKFMKRGRALDPVYAEREILNHRSLFHPHVVAFGEVFLTKNALCIVMEFASGGTLGNLVEQKKCLDERRSRFYFQQLILAMDYCHNMGVVMRDIKLNNLLLNEERRLIKICDFGFSKHLYNNTIPDTKLGTAPYIAPEILSSREYDGQRADIWTCGITLFHMIFGSPPIEMQRKGDGECTKDKLLRVQNEPIEIPIYQERRGQQYEVSEGCRDLLSKLLIKDPNERISVSEIKEHKWFTEYLPKGAYEYNLTLQNQQSTSESCNRNLQSAEEIKRIIKLAASSS